MAAGLFRFPRKRDTDEPGANRDSLHDELYPRSCRSSLFGCRSLLQAGRFFHDKNRTGTETTQRGDFRRSGQGKMMHAAWRNPCGAHLGLHQGKYTVDNVFSVNAWLRRLTIITESTAVCATILQCSRFE